MLVADTSSANTYPRPVIQPATQRSQPTPFVLSPPTPPTSAPLDTAAFESENSDIRYSVLSVSQLSDSPPRAPKSRLAYNPTRQSVAPSTSHSRHRANSLPIVEDQHKTEENSKDGAFKIVIDRANTQKPPVDEEALPSLEVPIPTYRLGIPRFSTQGTAFLRSSTYTRTSGSDYRGSMFARSDFDKLFPTPPGTSESELRPQSNRNFFRPSKGQAPISFAPSSTAIPPSMAYKMREPIHPSVFDTLATLMNDPSVVRYNPRTKDITAATPARIVAQISSESFMDYELVSDFFLTFRAYLRPDTLLNLLLARLQWAINRLSDDGRIIRIRTFAALRHWILNYFADDFLPNERLRMLFCNRINELHHEVKRQSVGTSDLKIVMDLKRCWNGRCALFWDSPEFAADTTPEADIIPGGLGTRDSQLSQIRIETPDRFSQPQNGLHERRLYENDAGLRGHVRTTSAGTTGSQGLPVSPLSEQSVQPMSCSIPAKPKKLPLPIDPAKGPHPVAVHSEQTSPAPNGQIHTREPESAAATHNMSIDPQELSVLSNGGSLARGNVFPPSSPFVDVVAPSSPTFQTLHFGADDDVTGANLRPGNAVNPGMKNLLGSIRRALSGKQSGSSAPLQSADTLSSMVSVKGQTSTVPLNVAFRNHSLNEKRAFRHQIRIDMLCAEVAESYRDTIIKHAEAETIGIAMGHPSEQALDQPQKSSQLLNASQSILIIDDTNENLPAMSGALNMDKLQVPIAGRQVSDMSIGKQSSGIFGDRRSRSLGPERRITRQRPFRSSSADQSRFDESASTTLKRRLSFEGSSGEQANKSNPAGTTLSGVGSNDDLDKTPRLLRRRPGGDLRKHQNVHDLEPMVSRQSAGSLATATDSIDGSVLVMADKVVPIGPPSMMKTHSSQKMRPSFEAAVARFAQIPDDDDGGIESTLLKLEGKYTPKPDTPESSPSEHAMMENKAKAALLERKVSKRDSPVLDVSDSDSSTIATDNCAITSSGPRFILSQEKYSSKPLRPHSKQLSYVFGHSTVNSDMSISSAAKRRREVNSLSEKRTTRSDVSMPRPLFSRNGTNESQKLVISSLSSIEVVEETESMKKIPKGSTLPEKSPTNDSFLLDEDEELSDLSSEMSDDFIDQLESPVLIHSEHGNISTHPLAHPPSPPHAVSTGNVSNLPYPKDPPTPDPSPKMDSAPFTGRSNKQSRQQQPNSGHIPFILACDSEVLAQQMTVVEKAALAEIDWNDLVEMRWDSNSHNLLNWVDLVSRTGVKGIDLVIARFNLVVKWVISEIILTQNLQERARTLTKYIRVAAHARKLHNYATMLQITIALTSIDCTRLTATWELVKYYEKQLLRDMEILTQPTRNFHELRSEMEGADVSDGCIPFVGEWFAFCC